ncbi:MAG: hypothetical protein HYX92_05280 [Chloroflexi bacterium]|nr:hypothetical protein [Chloroflexota bacterium]
MQDLVGEYFTNTTVAEAKRLKRGQICLGHALYLESNVATIALCEYKPENEHLNRYKVLWNTPREALFNHTPVHELQLASDEEFLVIKAKKRPLVILSERNEGWGAAADRTREKAVTCAPMYSFHERDTREFRDRVYACEYPCWVYVPKHDALHVKEGFLRLDRLQVIEESCLEPIPKALTESALYAVSEWLRYYLRGEIDPLFLDYRRQCLDALEGES